MDDVIAVQGPALVLVLPGAIVLPYHPAGTVGPEPFSDRGQPEPRRYSVTPP
jgi:hypothetical protein